MLLIARLCLQHLTVTVIDGDDNFPDCSYRPSYRINLTPLVLNIFFYFLPSADCWIYFYIWLFDCHFAQVTFVDGYCALQHSPPGCRLLSTTALNPLCRPNMSTSVDISTKRVKRLDRKLSYRWQVALSIIQQSFRSNTTVEMTSERYCYWLCTLYAVYLIYTQRNHYSTWNDLQRSLKVVGHCCPLLDCLEFLSLSFLIYSTSNNGVRLKCGSEVIKDGIDRSYTTSYPFAIVI